MIAVALGIGVFLVLRGGRGDLLAALVAWNAACWSWIAMIAAMMAGRSTAREREGSGEEDVGAWFSLLFVCVAAAASVAAIILELAGLPPGARYTPTHYLLAAGTVFGSWFAVGLAYASHYAHVYYVSDGDMRPLAFPEQPESPGYWDFLYFAFTISAAAQTSDVSVLGWQMRRLVVVHTVIGFLFNAVIIGFSINMFAGAIAH